MSTSWFGKHNLITTAIVALVFSLLGAGGFAMFSQHKSSLKTSSEPTVKGQTTTTLTTPLVSTPATSMPSTPQPTTQTNKQSNNPSSNSGSKYVAGVCTETVIPYNTTYVDDPIFPVGTQQSYGGTNGKKVTCTNDSTGYNNSYSTEPYDKTIYVGTKVATPPPAPQPTGISYEYAQSSCGALGTGGTSAFEQCMHAYGF